MSVPVNTSWSDAPVERSSKRIFERIVQPRPAVAVLPLIAAILLLPSLLSYTGHLMGIPLRNDFGIHMWNLALAVVAGLLLIYFANLQAEEKVERSLRLMLDAAGLGESGYKRLNQNWQLKWDRIDRIELQLHEPDPVLRIYTFESGDRPAHLLFDYPFDEVVPEINLWLAPFKKTVETINPSLD